MKNATLVVALLLGATPAFAQFGVGEITKRAGQAQQLAELSISEKEERDSAIASAPPCAPSSASFRTRR